MFETFERKREHCDNPMTISISPYGKFAFNKPASDLLKAKNINSVVLLFDKESKKIGIRAPKNLNEADYKLSNSQHKTYLVFCSQAFLKHISYPLKRTRSFPVTWNDEAQMYVITLPPIWNDSEI